MIAFAGNHHTIRWSQALRAAGLDVHVVCGHAAADGFSVPGVTVHPVRIEGPSVPVMSAAVSWHKALAAVQPDVVYMQWLFARPAMLVALDPRWPFVLTVMGSDVRQEASLQESWLDRVWRTALLLRADCITAAAEPLAQVVAAYHPNIAKRLVILPFGVDTADFRPDGSTRHRAPGVPLVIGHFKSDDPTYGRLQLLRALEPLVHQGLSFELHLAGWRGNDGGAVTAFLQAHPELAACTVDKGNVEVGAMPALYRALDVYVLNSVQESFGVAAAEALASGIPVIAADVGGVRTLVRQADTGLVVPVDDIAALRQAICEMAAHPALRASCGARGRARMQDRFRWDDSVTQLVGHLEAAHRKRVAQPEPQPQVR